MEQLYIAEKPAVAAALADFFSRHGNKFTKENGHFISIKKDIVITWAIGHLLMEYEPGDYTENWKSWWNTPLPLVPKKFMRKPFKDKKEGKDFRDSRIDKRSFSDLPIKKIKGDDDL